MIETARLILRPYREADRAPFRAMMADPDVMHDYPAPFSAEEADAYFERRRGQIAAHGFGKWAIERRADGDFLGFVGVSEAYPTLPVAPSPEIGWRLVRGAWAKGTRARPQGRRSSTRSNGPASSGFSPLRLRPISGRWR